MNPVQAPIGHYQRASVTNTVSTPTKVQEALKCQNLEFKLFQKVTKNPLILILAHDFNIIAWRLSDHTQTRS